MIKQYLLFQNGGIGDFLMALFLAEELHTQAGAERVYIQLHRRAWFLSEFAAGYPYVSVMEATAKNPFTFGPLLRLRGTGVTIIMPPTIGSFPIRVKLFVWLLSKLMGGELIGFQDNGPFCGLYSKTLPYKLDQDFAESMRDVVRALGFTPSGRPPRLHITPARSILSRLGLLAGKYIVVHPRGASERRQLTVREVTELVQHLLELRPEGRIFVSGAEHERDEIEYIVATLGNRRVVSAIGASVAELAALIEGAELFVGMDTGITHLACFLGKRALVIAKNATANWLPYYSKNATVIYRFEEEEQSHTSEAYMRENQNGRLRPFKDVPVSDISAELARMLGVPG